jgi:alpha-N-arabinofuranosidase
VSSAASAAPLLKPAVTPVGAPGSPALSAAIRIDAGKTVGHISPRLYGQFTEFMWGGIKGGMHAELVQDRGFEDTPNEIGLPRYWERDPDDRNDDAAMNFTWDGQQPLAGNRSLLIDVHGFEGNRRGIHQGNIPIRAGIPYRGSMWLKTDGFDGTVTVALEADETDGQRYGAATISQVAPGGWKQYQFDITPTQSDKHAKLSILLNGNGKVNVDQVSLMPGDNVAGIRRDVTERTRALAPSHIRWPGGNVAQDYHWQWAIGPRDARTSWVNDAWGHEVESSDFGTDEYVQWCRDLGTEPSLTVNVEGRGATAEEAANWVEYCNGPVTSKFGALRAANGHPEPYHVKYWEVGNEIWGPWNQGHSDAATYAANFNRYVAAMKAKDPSIQIIACGDNDMNWNRTVLSQCGQNIDFLSIHHYYGTGEMGGDASNLQAHPYHYERFYGDVRALIEQVSPKKDIQLDINEWNTALPEQQQHSMQSALYGARMMNVFERQGDTVGLSCVSDLVNGWNGGIIQASRTGTYVTPTYLVNQMYATHLGTERLSAAVDSPTFDTSREGKKVPYLDTVVSRSADGKSIFVKMVNSHETQALSTRVQLAGVKLGERGSLDVLNGDSLTAANNFSRPDAVRVTHSDVAASNDFTIELPPHSVSVLTLPVA